MSRSRTEHLTQYSFAKVVTLGPHRLLLRTPEGQDIRVVSSRLEISPRQAIKCNRGVYDNSAAVLSFRDAARYLSVRSEVSIEQYEESPLDFVVDDYAVVSPFQYQADEQPDLAPYQRPSDPNDESVIRDGATRVGPGQGRIQTSVVRDRLSKAIAGDFRYTVRQEPGVQSPGETLNRGSG